MGLSKYEKETVILFNDAEKTVSISTSQDFMKRKLKKYAEEHPDDVKIISEDQYTLIAETSKKYIRVSPPRFVSEKQRIESAERLRKYRENKSN